MWISIFLIGLIGGLLVVGVVAMMVAWLELRETRRRDMAAVRPRRVARPNRRLSTDVLFIQIRPLGLPGMLVARRDRIPRDQHQNVLN